MARSRSALFTILGFILSTACAVAILEIFLRLVFPQESLYPRWAFSPEYCFTVYPNVRMVHERPGRWRFVYTTNEHRFRGKDVAIAGSQEKPNIVVLGDSYSFGAGVNDGEEYSAVLERRLGGSSRVINLGIGGWGLTQEIRRFHDFGVQFKPKVVILQFSSNDPRDNLNCPVTAVSGGQFTFHDSHEVIFSIKKYLSRSLIQKSQIYNLFRDRIYRLAESRVVEKERASLDANQEPGSVSAEERVYIELLGRFAEDLRTRGVALVLLSVNGQLEGFPHIASAVRQLQEQGMLRYVDAADWLRDENNYSSPEGHLWGAKAHRIIGEHLEVLVRTEMDSRATDFRKP